MKNNLTIKKFMAAALGVVLFATMPTAVMANSVSQTGNTTVIEVSIESIAQAIPSVVPTQGGMISLRQLVDNLGATDVIWNGATRSIDVLITGSAIISALDTYLDIDISGLIHEGNLILPLNFTGNAVTIARGGAAGESFPATMVDNRIMLTPPALANLNVTQVLAQPIAASLEVVLLSLTGATSVSVEPAEDVFVITIVE